MSTSGLTTDLLLTHRLFFTGTLHFRSLLSEWVTFQVELAARAEQQKPLPRPNDSKTPNPQPSSAGLPWGTSFTCGSLSTQSRHIEIRWYLGPQPEGWATLHTDFSYIMSCIVEFTVFQFRILICIHISIYIYIHTCIYIYI